MPKSRSTAQRKATTSKPKIFKGSGNVFADLGLPHAEAVNLLARFRLMIQIKNILEDRRLTQSEAARILGVRQP
jgi:predicted XRE-type DNA-binding protein